MDGLRDGGHDELRSYVGTEWWHMGLPAYVKILFDEKRRAAVWHAEDVALANARATTAEQASRQSAADLELAEDELEELRVKLREAKVREAALWEVIERCRWS